MSAVLDGLNNLGSLIVITLLNPGWNPSVTRALYAAIGTFVLLVVVIVAMIFTGRSDRAKVARAQPKIAKKARLRVRSARRMSAKVRAFMGVGFALLLVVAWVTAGFTTSSTESCTSCHGAETAHAKAAKRADPHREVECVGCHEPGGVLGRYATGVPLRLLHFAMSQEESGSALGYGQVTARSCASCHAESLVGTRTNAKRGLRVSHEEPMAASATCIDCHTLRDGVVSVHSAGMKPCLRCHDGDPASAACVTCHASDVAAATRARSTSFQRAHVSEIACGGCHNEKRDCDPCHGLRMPHTAEFKSGAHARAATVGFWYNSGKGCRTCHTESRRPCRCHTPQLGGAHGASSSLPVSHRTSSAAACNRCHLQYASLATRDFCKDVCHSPAAIAASPR